MLNICQHQSNLSTFLFTAIATEKGKFLGRREGNKITKQLPPNSVFSRAFKSFYASLVKKITGQKSTLRKEREFGTDPVDMKMK